MKAKQRKIKMRENDVNMRCNSQFLPLAKFVTFKLDKTTI